MSMTQWEQAQIAEKLREELGIGNKVGLPAWEMPQAYEQRDYTASQRSYLCPGVAAMVPFKGKLLIASNYSGGIYSFPPLREVYLPPNATDMERGYQAVYVMGTDGRIDSVFFLMRERVIKVSPDFTATTTDVINSDLYSLGLVNTAWDSEDGYLHIERGYVYSLNFKDMTWSKLSKCGTDIEGWGMVYYSNKLYIPGDVPWTSHMGLWEYDIGADAWTQLESSRKFLITATATKHYWFVGDDFIMATDDFATFKYAKFPSVAGGSRSYSAPLHLSADSMACVMGGILWIGGVVDGEIQLQPLRGALFDVGALAYWEECLVLGSKNRTFGGAVSSPPADGLQAGFSFIPKSELQGSLPPAKASLWDSASVAGGEYSDPVLTNGWRSKTLYFYTDSAGDLTIEVDPIGMGDWQTYKTISGIGAGTWIDPYIMTGDFMKLRLKFSANATVTARLVYQP